SASGLSISPTGLITGTPAIPASYQVVVTVADGHGGYASRTLSWNVTSNTPPVCSTASALPALLWPPDHKFAAIGIAGITDPDGDSVTVRIARILQDEVVTGDRGNGAGSGNT